MRKRRRGFEGGELAGLFGRIIISALTGDAAGLYLRHLGFPVCFCIWFVLMTAFSFFAGLELADIVSKRSAGKEYTPIRMEYAILIILILCLFFIIMYLLGFCNPFPEKDGLIARIYLEDSEEPVPEFVSPVEVYDEAPVSEPVIPEIPKPPEFISVTRVLVETEDEIPVMKDEAAQDEAFEEEFYEEEDDAFWDDWFMGGEDEFILETGISHMILLINGSYKGDIDVLVDEYGTWIPTKTVTEAIGTSLTEESHSRIFDDAPEYMSAEDYIAKGVDAYVDGISFVVSLNFSTEDMPWKVISLKGGGTKKQSVLADADEPARAFAVAKASFSPSATFTQGSWNVTSGVSMELSLGKLRGTGSGWLTYDGSRGFSYGVGGFSLSYDIPSSLMRISFGSVRTGLLSLSGKSVGVMVEKSPSYAEEGWRSPSPHSLEIVVEEDSMVEILNGGKTMLKRRMKKGSYRLEDLILTEGLNDIDVKITPVSGNEATGVSTILNWSPSLLAKGETYWSAAYSAGIGKTTGEHLAYGAIRTGFTKTITLDATGSVALKNSSGGKVLALSANVSGIIATTGKPVTTGLSFQMSNVKDFRTMQLTAKADGKFRTKAEKVTDIGWGLSWTGSNLFASNTITGKANVSGKTGMLNWSLSGSFKIITEDIKKSNLAVSGRIHMVPKKGLNISASATFGLDGTGKAAFTGRIGISYSFGKSNVSADSSLSDGSMGWSWNSDATSLSASWRGAWAELDELSKYSFQGNTSFSALGYPVRLSAAGNLDGSGITGTVSGNVSAIFADGLFAITPNLEDRTLLIRQKGVLKGNTVSAAATKSTEMTELKSFLGTSIYTGMPSGQLNLMVSSDPKDGGGISAVKYISLPSEKWGTYIYRMKEKATYSVAGRITSDSDAGNEMAFLLQTWQEGEEGHVLVPTEQYIFTDNNGKFVAESLSPGDYAFEVPAREDGTGWSLRMFTVSEDWDYRRHTLLKETKGDDVSGYDNVYVYIEDGTIERDELVEWMLGQ